MIKKTKSLVLEMQDYELLVKQIPTEKLEMMRIIIGKELNERIIASHNKITGSTDIVLEGVQLNGKRCVVLKLPKAINEKTLGGIFQKYGTCSIEYQNDRFVYIIYENFHDYFYTLSSRTLIKETLRTLLVSP